MVVKGIGIVFLKKRGELTHIYRQGITRYSQEYEEITYYDRDGDRFRIVSCMHPADESDELYIQGESHSRDKHKMVIHLPRLRLIFNALVFSQDACQRPHTTIVL